MPRPVEGERDEEKEWSEDRIEKSVARSDQLKRRSMRTDPSLKYNPIPYKAVYNNMDC